MLYVFYNFKYLDIRTDENLNWTDNANDVPVKLNRANVLYLKLRILQISKIQNQSILLYLNNNTKLVEI